METFYGLASGELNPAEALSDGRVELLTGKRPALERFFSVFNFTHRAQVAV
jgi:hypothetical protein